MPAAKRRADKEEVGATQHANAKARALAETLPRLILEARRIAATVIHGLHGRKRAGPGESFWQYRRFMSGEPARRVDWRRSARDGILYVREQEWEASHTVWLWPDRSPSMVFRSDLAKESKLDRTLVIAFAIAEVLVHAGERVGVPGLLRPTGSRNVIDKFANAGGRHERAGLHFLPCREVRMIPWLPLGFAQPLVLLGLLSLPVLWWLLRMIPPQPRRIDFPPTRLLFQIKPKEETPRRTPWWLTLLRLTLATLVILAAAGPLWNPPIEGTTSRAPIALMIDDSFVAAGTWEARIRTAEDLIGRAGTDKPA